MEEPFPRTIIEFTNRFASDEACAEYIRDLRWPDGFICPSCGSREGWLTSRKTISCASCKKQTSITSGTILHGSHIPLTSWFMAMWLICTQKTGLSAAGLQRSLGLGSYRSAWLMLQKLRRATIRMGREDLRGTIEVDETYIGGEEEGIRGRQLINKSLVVIAVELSGRKVERIRLLHIPDASGKSLVGFITDCVEPGARVHTDGWRGYNGLTKAGFSHYVTNTRGDGQLAVDVFPHVHLVASLLKRWLGATHQGRVGPKHLQGYLDEFSFRFNRRKSRHVGKIFHRLAEQVVLRQADTYSKIIDN